MSNTVYADELWTQFGILIHIPAVVDRYENEKARKQEYIKKQWQALALRTYKTSKQATK